MTLLLLGGCIDGEEEVFIMADGSARVKVMYRVPGVIFSAKEARELVESVAAEVAKEENLRLITNRVDRVKGRRIINIELETDDVMELEESLANHAHGSNPNKAEKMMHAIMGNITVNLIGLSAGLTREVDLAPMLEENMGKGRVSLLGDSEFRYIVHLPKAAKISNAHLVENGGRTLKWAFQLSECGERPILMKVTAPIPLPWWFYVLVGLVLVVLIGVIWLWVRRKN